MEIRKYIRKQWIKTTLSAAESVPLLFIKDWDQLKITYHFQSPCTHLQTTKPFLKQISVSYKLVNYYFKVHVTSHITWLKQISLLPLTTNLLVGLFVIFSCLWHLLLCSCIVTVSTKPATFKQITFTNVTCTGLTYKVA